MTWYAKKFTSKFEFRIAKILLLYLYEYIYICVYISSHFKFFFFLIIYLLLSYKLIWTILHFISICLFSCCFIHHILSFPSTPFSPLPLTKWTPFWTCHKPTNTEDWRKQKTWEKQRAQPDQLEKHYSHNVYLKIVRRRSFWIFREFVLILEYSKNAHLSLQPHHVPFVFEIYHLLLDKATFVLLWI